MTTEAFFAERGITMAEAHGALMDIVQSLLNWPGIAGNLGRDLVAQGYVSVFADYGITEQMLADVANYGSGWSLTAGQVRSFFDAFGADTSTLPGSLPNPYVYAISSPTITEGESLSFHVILNTAAVMPMRYALEATGDALYDLAGYSITNGVWLDVNTMEVVVPEGVGSFDIHIDIAEDTAVEGTETLALHLGDVDGYTGYTATGTVHDNDTAPPPVEGVTLMPYDLAAMVPFMRLNGQTGILATANLRDAIIAQTSADAYWQLFDPARYTEAADGLFTTAEIGWSLGTLPATAEMVESLFYGTAIHALKAVNFAEYGQLEAYVDSTGEYVDTAELDVLVQLLANAFTDDSGAAVFFHDTEVAFPIVEAGVELVGMVEYQPSIFHALVNWAL